MPKTHFPKLPKFGLPGELIFRGGRICLKRERSSQCFRKGALFSANLHGSTPFLRSKQRTEKSANSKAKSRTHGRASQVRTYDFSFLKVGFQNTILKSEVTLGHPKSQHFENLIWKSWKIHCKIALYCPPNDSYQQETSYFQVILPFKNK